MGLALVRARRAGPTALDKLVGANSRALLWPSLGVRVLSRAWTAQRRSSGAQTVAARGGPCPALPNNSSIRAQSDRLTSYALPSA